MSLDQEIRRARRRSVAWRTEQNCQLGVQCRRHLRHAAFQCCGDEYTADWELAKRLSPEFVLRTQDEIPWSDIRGMRNIIAHDYGKLSENTVREIELRDIPKLAAFCEKVLSAAKTQNGDIPEAESARNQTNGQKDLER